MVYPKFPALQVASPLHTSLAGALTSDCDDELTTEIVVDWQSGDSLPACNMPGFTELYMIPDGCFAFPDGLMESCALSMEDVLVVRFSSCQLVKPTRTFTDKICTIERKHSCRT